MVSSLDFTSTELLVKLPIELGPELIGESVKFVVELPGCILGQGVGNLFPMKELPGCNHFPRHVKAEFVRLAWVSTFRVS